MTAFHFANPAGLAMLLVAPVLWLLFRHGDRRRKSALQAWGGSPALPLNPRRRHLKRLLQLAAAIALAIALARPSLRIPPPPVITKTGDIVFLLDVSRSMLADDVAPSRLAAAKTLVSRIAAEARGQRLGLVAFAGSQSVECPLTPDHAFFLEMLAGASRESVPRGGSMLGDAIRFTVDQVFDDTVRDRRTIVLVSDGGDRDDAGDSPASAVREASRRGVGLMTIGIGDAAQGALVPESAADRTPVLFQGRAVRTRLNVEVLREIAAASPRGAYLSAAEGLVDPAALYRRYLVPDRASRPQPESGDTGWLVMIVLALALLAVEPRISDRKAQAAVALIAALLLWPGTMSAQTVEEWFAKGLEALKKGNAQEAMHFFGDTSRWAPDVPEVRFNLAKSLYEFKAYHEASLSFAQAVKLSPDPLFKASSRVGQGNAMFRESEQLPPMQAIQRLQQCIAAYQEALQLDPHVFHAEHNLHVAERRLEQLRDQAFGSQDAKNAGQSHGPRADPQQVLDQSARPRPSSAKRPLTAVQRDW